MASVLVTGATGFIGSHLTALLAARGYSVRCLVRKPPRSRAFRAPALQVCLGDIFCPASLARAVAGVDVVFHLAGSTIAPNLRVYRRGNVCGTRNLAQACAACRQPPVLVFVSSLAAAGPALNGRPRTEADPAGPVSNYGKSKRAAELVLEQLAARLPITVVRPPTVFGPGDRFLVRLFQTIRWGWNIIPGPAGQRFSLIQVDDLADGLLRAAQRGSRLPAPPRNGTESVAQARVATPLLAPRTRVGNAGTVQGLYYVARPEQPSLVELGQLVATALEVPRARTLYLPRPVYEGLALLNDTFGLLLGKPVFLGVDKMREGTAGSWTCAGDRAEQELGCRPRQDLQTQLCDTARWYREQGWL